MKLDDLKAGWKAEVKQSSAAIDLTNVIKSIEKETSKLDRTVKRRDILEISIAILLIPVWVWQLFVVDNLIQIIGLLVAIFACLFIPYKMIKAKQVEPQKDNSVLAFLEVEKIKLENQKKLLESIAVWYIAPLMLAIVLFTAGATTNEAGIPQIDESLAIYYFSCALFSVGVYWLNKRSAKKQFAPVLNKVNQRIKELTELNDGPN
jgi:Ca2+/Na+ antiporter